MPRLTYEVPRAPLDITNQAWNDPWFAVGNLLARAWNKQYDERGIKKLMDSMSGTIPGQDATESVPTLTPEQNAQNIFMNNYNAANPLPQVGTGQIQGPEYTAGSNIPGMLEAGNIDLTNRPVVQNPDGTISTVRSVGVNLDGKEYLLPTISDDGRQLSTEEAVDQFRKTGNHLGIFDTPDAATNYAQTLHNQQAQMYGNQAPSLSSFSQAVQDAANGNLDYNQFNQVLSGQTPTADTVPKIDPNSALARQIGNYVEGATGTPAQANLLNAAANAANTPPSYKTSVPQRFNYDEWEASMREAGRRQGRPDYQIQEAIDRMAPAAKAAETKYNDYMSGQLISALGPALEDAQQSGDYSKVYGLYNELEKYDPDYAKRLLTNTTSPKDIQSHLWDENKTNEANQIWHDRANTTYILGQQGAENQLNRDLRKQEGMYILSKKYGITPRGYSSGARSSSSSSGKSGGGTPSAQNQLIANMAESARNAFASGNLDQIQKVTSDIQTWLDAVDADPEERYKYSDSVYNIMKEAAYTGNNLASYLNGDITSADQYGSAVMNAGSPWAPYLYNNRIKK